MNDTVYRITWNVDPKWKNVDQSVPRPQGNLPMFAYGLTENRQRFLIDRYLGVNRE
jgi:hypothetical protein